MYSRSSQRRPSLQSHWSPLTYPGDVNINKSWCLQVNSWYIYIKYYLLIRRLIICRWSICNQWIPAPLLWITLDLSLWLLVWQTICGHMQLIHEMTSTADYFVPDTHALRTNCVTASVWNHLRYFVKLLLHHSISRKSKARKWRLEEVWILVAEKGELDNSGHLLEEARRGCGHGWFGFFDGQRTPLAPSSMHANM